MDASATPYDEFLHDLKQIRVAKGLSQGELAKKIHLSRAQYTAIENGRSVLNYVHIYNLSVALSVKFVVGDPNARSASRYRAT